VPLTSIVETLGIALQPSGMMADAVVRTRSRIMPFKTSARFPRTARLLRHADFERVYKQGRRHFSASMTVFYWARPEPGANEPTSERRKRTPALPGLRIGFTVGRALGGAVQRNRMKRRLREAVRMSLPVAGVAADVVINPKKSLLAADFADLQIEVKRAFEVIEQELSSKAHVSVNPAKGILPDVGKRF
jgi:ribonuclease P protein component